MLYCKPLWYTHIVQYKKSAAINKENINIILKQDFNNGNIYLSSFM